MRVEDLDGRRLNWNARGTQSLFDGPGSGLHQLCRGLLKEKYPTVPVLEEVSFPVRTKKTLYFDFYIPMLNMAIEVQGEQHFKFVKHFHRTKMAFAKQRKNDQEKRDWCYLNRISLVELRHDETDEWINQI